MKNYFCIENLAKRKINILEIKGVDVEYSFDTVNWIALNKLELKFNKRKLYLRSTSISYINCKTYFNVSGNIMSLLYGNKFTGNETTFNRDGTRFYSLFSNDSYLLDASNLILPATTLTDHCYHDMFSGCTKLTSAPQLPATTLANGCYINMFRRCTSLTEAPQLPATTLAKYCYSGVFWGCASLTSAPQLPATELANGCYEQMFWGCISLTKAPELPATTLADGCYNGMFRKCTSLISAPELLAITLTEECYSWMFEGCTSLIMAPELPATELVKSCYTSMFYGCTLLKEITINITKLWDRSNTICWLKNVSTHGIIFNKGKVKGISLNDNNGCPSGWTIKEID